MKKTKSILWGIVLVAVGAILSLNALNITEISLLFDGWWTLFIIVPCAVALFTESNKLGNIVSILIGVFLLLCCQDILEFSMLWKLVIPIVILLFGLKLIFGTAFTDKTDKIKKAILSSGRDIKSATATFSGQTLNYSGQVFNGAEFNAIFGGIKCDLTGAIITEDCVIGASAIFGGIDIIVPSNVNVKIHSDSIFGGVSNKCKNEQLDNRPTVYINAACIFGGVDIK